MITDLLVAILKEHRLEYENIHQISAYYSDQIKEIAKQVYNKQCMIVPGPLAIGFLIKK